MRGFFVLAFVVAAASAASLGYDYGAGVAAGNGVESSQLVGSQSVGIGSVYSGIESLGGAESSQSGVIGEGVQSVDGSIGGSLGGSVGGHGGTTVVGIDAVNAVPQTVEYNKQVFYFSAPEEEQDEGQLTQQLSNVLKKNLQVVFIKAPENNAATNAALQLAKQAIEQKTAIYLLSKENDGSQLIAQLQQIQENVPTVPEVRIIKYRTQEDLINAKASIQAQYDHIGGHSPLINGGVVPVLNYASAGGAVSGGVSIIGGGGSHGGHGGGRTISLAGGSYSRGYTRIDEGRPLVGGVTKFIGGSISSGGGYLPPFVRK